MYLGNIIQTQLESGLAHLIWKSLLQNGKIIIPTLLFVNIVIFSPYCHLCNGIVSDIHFNLAFMKKIIVWTTGKQMSHSSSKFSNNQKQQEKCQSKIAILEMNNGWVTLVVGNIRTKYYFRWPARGEHILGKKDCSVN